MRLTVFLWLLVSLLPETKAQVQQVDTTIINGTTFLFKKTVEQNHFLGNVHDTVWKIYRLKEGKTHYLLEHPVRQTSADCNNEFEDEGTYRISGDTLFFHTDMSQQRSDPIPTSRDQAYLVKPDGKLVPLYDHLYGWNGELIDQ